MCIRDSGRTLENAKLIMQDDKVMIPLRAVCEALDFEVKWDGEAEKIELVNLPLYITCTPYTLSLIHIYFAVTVKELDGRRIGKVLLRYIPPQEEE